MLFFPANMTEQNCSHHVSDRRRLPCSNYIAFIRRALKKAGMEQIPVISLNLSGLESNPGFKLTLPLIKRIVYGAVFGDILMNAYIACVLTSWKRVS